MSDPTPSDAAILAEQSATLATVTSHPQFLEILSEIQAEPEDQRMQKAEQLASVETLRARGIPVPEGLRLTTRYFENPTAATISEQTIQSEGVTPFLRPISVCVSAGYYFVCVSVGAEF